MILPAELLFVLKVVDFVELPVVVDAVVEPPPLALPVAAGIPDVATTALAVVEQAAEGLVGVTIVPLPPN
jgi:hypothetical protein